MRLCAIFIDTLYINKNPIKHTTVETAEMIKYASNSFLALKISYINEIANLCETVGADIHDVASAMGQDGRISDKFLHPGPGLEVLFSKRFRIINCYIKRKIYHGDFKCCKKANINQKAKMGTKLENLINASLKDKKIAVLGLSFKANTDDVRESSSIDMIEFILIRVVLLGRMTQSQMPQC